MRYVIDIDGTICTNENGNYNFAKPYSDRIQKINELYDSGHTIILFTARGMGRSDNNRTKAYEEFYDLTLEQISKWNVKFHKLILGKPSGDIYIDDKGINANEFFQ